MARQYDAFRRVRVAYAGYVPRAARIGGVCRLAARRGRQQNAGRAGNGHLRADAGIAATAFGYRLRQIRAQENHLCRADCVCGGQLPCRRRRYAAYAGCRARHTGCGSGQCGGYRAAGGFDARRRAYPRDGDDRFEYRSDVFGQPRRCPNDCRCGRRSRTVYADRHSDRHQHRRGGVDDSRPGGFQAARRYAGTAFAHRRSFEKP